VKVLLVADFYPPQPGGLEAHVERLAGALAGRGHAVTVATVDTGTVARARAGVEVVPLPLSLARAGALYQAGGHPFHPPWADPAFTKGLRGLAARVRPDVVHAHGWCAFSARAAGQAPLVVTLHDYGLCCPKKTLLRGGRECPTGRGLHCLDCEGREQGLVKRAGLAAALGLTAGRVERGAARFLAVSGHVAERHLRAGLDPARVEVVPNFLDLPSAQAPTTESAREILFVGPDSPHKGRSVLVEAFRRLDDPGARLVLVGDGEPVEHPSGRVECPGRLGGDALWERYRRAAVVVVPSVWPEPCPTVAIEAMAWGRPIVASRAGGLTDLVDDGRTGLLVPPGDPGAMARALGELLGDEAGRRHMAAAAAVRARDFSTATVVPRIEAIYGEVAAGRLGRTVGAA
jgi:glycosyltransferase involved in cell wall biosynthesis